MNAAEQRLIAQGLRAALADYGIVVRRPIRQGGNIGGYEDVPVEALLGAWLKERWIISMDPPEQELVAGPFWCVE